jgi:hypothetical protein
MLVLVLRVLAVLVLDQVSPARLSHAAAAVVAAKMRVQVPVARVVAALVLLAITLRLVERPTQAVVAVVQVIQAQTALCVRVMGAAAS